MLPANVQARAVSLPGMEPAQQPAHPEITQDAVAMLADMRQLRNDFARFMLSYKFGLEEITTKVRILQEEFRTIHSYNPIEHLSGRLKSPESMLEKVRRTGCEPDFDHIREKITDIAGIRVTCSFVSDVYRVFEMLTGQQDVKVLRVKDYVAHPKPNGYRSLHAIVEVPVFLSDRSVLVPVEVQFRTVAMDFWASLEHKIYYKYQRDVPRELSENLHRAAMTAAQLDEDMEHLHRQIHGDGGEGSEESAADGVTEQVLVQLLRQRAAVVRSDVESGGIEQGGGDVDLPREVPAPG